MSTAQEKIRIFMNSLDNTSQTGINALDEAVRACSKFSNTAEWLNALINDCNNAKAQGQTASQILSSVCGIELYNDDTGAISGADAGSGTTKTAESIIPENSTISYPASSTSTFNGLTVQWPTGNLTNAQQLVLYGLNSWWINEGLNLITSSLGLSFSETGTTTKTMNVQFVDASSTSTLAATQYTYDSNGKTTGLTLYINMAYYNSVHNDNYNGISDNTAVYLDRLLAHELTHAVMAANITSMASLPEFVREGTAELIQGIDDLRPANLLALASDSAELSGYLDVNNTTSASAYTYTAGYMALRYLAKNGGDPVPVFTSIPQAYYNSSQTSITITSGISGELWLDGGHGITFASTVQEVDASSSDGSVLLAGNSNANLIKSGSGTASLWGGSGNISDTLQGGSGRDSFYFGTNDGSDYITNGSAADKVMIYSSDFTYTSANLSGSSLIIHSGSGNSLTLTNWSENSLNTFQLANGEQYKFVQSGSNITPQRI